MIIIPREAIFLLLIFNMPAFLITYFVGLSTPDTSKKNIYFGVKIPTGYRDRSNLKAVRSQFRKTYTTSYLLYILIFIPLCILVSSMTIWLYSIFGLIFIVYINTYIAYKKVLAIKKEEKWFSNLNNENDIIIVDTSFRDNTQSKLLVSPMWFLIPIGLIIINIVLSIIKYDMINSLSYLIVMILAQFVNIAIIFTAYIIAGRAKQQLDLNNIEESKSQSRAFRFRMSVFFILNAVIVELLFTFVNINTLKLFNISSFTFNCLVFCVVFIQMLLIIVLIYTTGQGGSRISVKGIENKNTSYFDKDDDRFWIMGSFYYNPDDPTLFIEKREGIGWDFNYARPAARVFMSIIGAIIMCLLIGMPIMENGLNTSAREDSITITTDSLTVKGMYSLNINFSQMKSIELKDSMPKILSKLNGLGTKLVHIGYFNVKDMGKVKLYLRSNNGPFIFLNTDIGYIIINYSDSTRTVELYNELLVKLK